MDPLLSSGAIEKATQDGKTPFYVNATAGTTVLGSFDPFPAIADICQKYKLYARIIKRPKLLR